MTLCLSAVAQGQSPYHPSVQEEQKAEDTPLELPAAPLPKNWLVFPTIPSATQKFFIDSASLSIDKNDVIRYTLISKSSSGAINISYEGIRCTTHEKKQYALGRADGTWSMSRRNQWEPIIGQRTNPAYFILAQDYFCKDRTNMGNIEKIISKLRDLRPHQEK